jgi:hypothetical protein
MYLGFFLLAAAVAAVIIGFLQRSKMNRILAAPFKSTGQVVGAADAQGNISCQGTIQPAQQLIAPCSGQPCIYYEIEIKQEWEKHVATEDGTKKQTGSDSAHSVKTGSMFYVNDGSGPIGVNATDGVDAKLKESFSEKKSYGWGDISFGGFNAHINRPSDSDKHAVATKCVEKILPATGDLFVLGKLEGNVITKRDGMLGKLMLAAEGRDGLLGSTKRNMIIGFVAAGIMLPSGAAMAIFGEAPEAAADTCVAMKDDIEAPCLGRMYGSDDVTYTWEVTEEADYKLSAVGTGKDTNMRLWPDVEVKKDGETVFSMAAPDGKPIEGKHHFEVGTYSIVINDTHYGWAENLEGGAGFSLEIDQVGGKVEKPAGEDETAEGGDVAAGSKPGTVNAKGPAKTTGGTTGSKTGTTGKTDDKAAVADTPEDKPADEVKPEEKAEEKAEEKTEPPASDDKPAAGVKPRLKFPGK